MKYIKIFTTAAAAGFLATNIAMAAPSPVEKACNSSMDTMISFRTAMRNGKPKEKLMEIATRKNPALPEKYSEFLSNVYVWAIKNSDLPEGEFRYDGNMYCYLEYDRLKI